jgi:predicted amidohydrolase
MIGDVDGNRRLLRLAIRKAADEGARLIVLPELCTTGYVFESLREARALTDAGSADAVTDWVEEAALADVVVVGGFAATDGTALYNCAAIVDGSGLLATYRKTHLWNRELAIFEPGDEAPPVVSTPLGAVGLCICYDLFFPEVTRKLALDGADVIVAPTNSPAGRSAETAGDNIGVSVARVAANVNRVFVAVCDRYGDERGTRWVGRSLIADPDGAIVGLPPGNREKFVLADCDFRRSRDKRWPGTANDAIADRRPELYRQWETSNAS